jgi:peptide/nickel transport system substrate-binding protein
LFSPAAAALGRKPYGGQLVMTLPFGVAGVDPHQAFDAVAALLSASFAEPLFASDVQGRAYPSLVEGYPERTSRGLRLTLREGLVSARGRALSARDVAFSLSRAARGQAAGLLAEFGNVELDRHRSLDFSFRAGDPERLARALSSVATSLVPRGFSAASPDGTGPFLATPSPGALVLTRNERAARGPALLDRVVLKPALDLGAALRAFETGESDVGWLGQGLHRPRPNAVSFDAGLLGWVVLRTGQEARAWGAPGVAQRLLDALGPARLGHLGLESVGTDTDPAPGWGGPSGELLVDESAPQLIEIARTLAAAWSRPQHAVTPRAVPAPELARARASGRFLALLDFVAAFDSRAPVWSLLAAVDPALARTPPSGPLPSPRQLGQTLALGVVGELRWRGAHVPGLRGLALGSLGSAFRSG